MWTEGVVDKGDEEWQDVARGGLEEGGGVRIKVAGGGLVKCNYSVDTFGGERDKVGTAEVGIGAGGWQQG